MLQSCIKEENTTQIGYLCNNTSHDLKVYFYNSSHPFDSISINPFDSVMIGYSTARGDVNSPGFGVKFDLAIYGYSSVLFDDEFEVFHYLNSIEDSLSKHYPYNSNRNLLNPKSYSFEKIRTKKKKENIHIYTFTEDDYNYAKD